MNNRGLSLVELLAVIAIIGFIGGIGAVAYNMIIRQSETRVYEAYEKTMHAETMQLLVNNVQLLPKAEATTPKRFTLSDIKIEAIKNPRNEKDLCPRSYVDVTRKMVGSVNSFTYKVCLICDDYNSDGKDCEVFEN